MKKPIQDNEKLERETNSGAVLNRDSTALLEAKARKQKRQAERDRVSALEADVRNLNKKIDALHTMMRELIRSKE